MTLSSGPFDATDDIDYVSTRSGPVRSEPKSVPTRFAQLTYSSFDDGTGIGGGWQVKETSGNLDDRESEALRYWVHTTFDLVTPLPQFPTPEDVDSFPRRLMYTALDQGRAVCQ